MEALIKQNNSQYAGPGRDFRVIDLTASDLPVCDLVFTRDCLNHLSIAHIRKAVANIRSSGSQFLAVTQFSAQTVNRNQESGLNYRELNFQLAAFHWPAPLEINDKRMHPGKHTAFWRTTDLPSQS